MPDDPRRRRRQAPDLGTNTSPDAVPEDIRRGERPNTPPDSLPPSDHEREIDRPDAAIEARIA